MFYGMSVCIHELHKEFYIVYIDILKVYTAKLY